MGAGHKTPIEHHLSCINNAAQRRPVLSINSIILPYWRLCPEHQYLWPALNTWLTDKEHCRQHWERRKDTIHQPWKTSPARHMAARALSKYTNYDKLKLWSALLEVLWNMAEFIFSTVALLLFPDLIRGQSVRPSVQSFFVSSLWKMDFGEGDRRVQVEFERLLKLSQVGKWTFTMASLPPRAYCITAC